MQLEHSIPPVQCMARNVKAAGCLVGVAQCTKVALLHYWAVFSLTANRGPEWYSIEPY